MLYLQLNWSELFSQAKVPVPAQAVPASRPPAMAHAPQPQATAVAPEATAGNILGPAAADDDSDSSSSDSDDSGSAVAHPGYVPPHCLPAGACSGCTVNNLLSFIWVLLECPKGVCIMLQLRGQCAVFFTYGCLYCSRECNAALPQRLQSRRLRTFERSHGRTRTVSVYRSIQAAQRGAGNQNPVFHPGVHPCRGRN